MQMKLVQHAYSGLFGTFLFKDLHEQMIQRLSPCTVSVWSLLHALRPQFTNKRYSPEKTVGFSCYCAYAISIAVIGLYTDYGQSDKPKQ